MSSFLFIFVQFPHIYVVLKYKKQYFIAQKGGK